MDPFGSTALNVREFGYNLGCNLYFLRRYGWIHRVFNDPSYTGFTMCVSGWGGGFWISVLFLLFFW